RRVLFRSCSPRSSLYYRPNIMPSRKPMPRIIALFAILTTLLAGCSSLRFPGVYRIDIPQGNVVTEDMLSGLRPGMTPEQVRFVLGPPTLTDPFTPNTWYYLLQYQPGNGEMVEQQIVVHFDQGH